MPGAEVVKLAVVGALIELLKEKGIISSLLKEGIITKEEWRQRTAKWARVSEGELDKILSESGLDEILKKE